MFVRRFVTKTVRSRPLATGSSLRSLSSLCRSTPRSAAAPITASATSKLLPYCMRRHITRTTPNANAPPPKRPHATAPPLPTGANGPAEVFAFAAALRRAASSGGAAPAPASTDNSAAATGDGDGAGSHTVVRASNAAAAASYSALGASIDPAFPNTEPQHLMKQRIDGYGNNSFQVNGLVFRGSIIAFPNFTLLWSPKVWEEVTVDHLALIPLIEPKIEMVIFGGGEHTYYPTPAIQQFLASHDIAWEPMNALNACATFTMLNAEERPVCAVMLAVPDSPEDDHISDERKAQIAFRDKLLGTI